MKIFIDHSVLQEMIAMTQERLFHASATDAPSSANGGSGKPAPLDRADTAENGLRLVGAIATIYANYRITTEMLERQVRPRRRRMRALVP